MALIKLGAVVVEISGSIDGITYARNRFGQYARQRVAPVQPRTPAQTEVRNRFGTLSQAWRALTPAQRAAWRSAAESVTLYNSLGEAYVPTGAQLYQSVNLNLGLLGLPNVSTPPLSPTITPLVSSTPIFNVDSPFTDSEINPGLTPTTPGTGFYFVVEATAPASPGRSFFPRSAYKLIFVGAANGAIPTTLAPQYVAVFGTFSTAIEGSVVSFRTRKFSSSGFASAPLRADAIVSAA